MLENRVKSSMGEEGSGGCSMESVTKGSMVMRVV